jgi:hypothetical protein
MSVPFPETLHLDGQRYITYRYPLEDYLGTLPARPRLPQNSLE